MPRIYVADLAAYNAGRLHGKWIDLEGLDADDVYRIINEEILATSPVPLAEEFAIHDYEGFGDFRVHEYESIPTVVAVAELMEEHGEGPVGAFLGYHGTYYTDDLEKAKEDFEESYQGQWESEEKFADNFLENAGLWDEIPEWAQPYFDVERYAHTLFIDDYYSIDAGLGEGVYVFLRT